MKICPACRNTLPLSEFYRNRCLTRRRRDGRADQCRACVNAYDKARAPRRAKNDRARYVAGLSSSRFHKWLRYITRAYGPLSTRQMDLLILRRAVHLKSWGRCAALRQLVTYQTQEHRP